MKQKRELFIRRGWWSASNVTAQNPQFAAWITLTLASAVGFFTLFAILTVSPLIRLIIKELSLTFAEGGLLFSVLVAMIVVGALLGGYAGDRLGIKTALGAGAVLVGVGAPLRGLATEYLVLLFFMALVGLGYGFILPNLPKLVQGWFPPNYLGQATGIYLACLFAGAAFGISATLPIYNFLANSWRNTLLDFGLISTLAAAVWWLAARNPPGSSTIRGPNSAAPEEGVRAWSNGQIWLVALLLTAMNVFFYTLGGWLPTIFIERGSAADAASLMASMAYFLAIPAALVIPRLSDRVGRRKPFLLILALAAAAASYALLIAPVALGWLLAATLGFATAGIMVICYMLPVELVPSSALGKASGIVVSVGFVGGIVGPYTAGLLRDTTQSFAAVIVLLILSAFLAAAIALTIRETGRRGKSEVRSERSSDTPDQDSQNRTSTPAISSSTLTTAT